VRDKFTSAANHPWVAASRCTCPCVMRVLHRVASDAVSRAPLAPMRFPLARRARCRADQGDRTEIQPGDRAADCRGRSSLRSHHCRPSPATLKVLVAMRGIDALALAENSDYGGIARRLPPDMLGWTCEPAQQNPLTRPHPGPGRLTRRRSASMAGPGGVLVCHQTTTAEVFEAACPGSRIHRPAPQALLIVEKTPPNRVEHH